MAKSYCYSRYHVSKLAHEEGEGEENTKRGGRCVHFTHDPFPNGKCRDGACRQFSQIQMLRSTEAFLGRAHGGSTELFYRRPPNSIVTRGQQDPGWSMTGGFRTRLQCACRRAVLRWKHAEGIHGRRAFALSWKAEVQRGDDDDHGDVDGLTIDDVFDIFAQDLKKKTGALPDRSDLHGFAIAIQNHYNLPFFVPNTRMRWNFCSILEIIEESYWSLLPSQHGRCCFAVKSNIKNALFCNLH